MFIYKLLLTLLLSSLTTGLALPALLHGCQHRVPLFVSWLVAKCLADKRTIAMTMQRAIDLAEWSAAQPFPQLAGCCGQVADPGVKEPERACAKHLRLRPGPETGSLEAVFHRQDLWLYFADLAKISAPWVPGSSAGG